MIATEEMQFQPLPVPDADSAPFWSACAAHRLVIQHCSSCGAPRFPPAPVCHRCRSWDFDWKDHSGRGRVYSWVVVHHPIPPSMAPETPYIAAIIELDGGVRMPARLLGIRSDRVTPDLPVVAAFRDVADDLAIPVFVPDAGTHPERETK